MKALEKRARGIGNLALVEKPVPDPKPSDVLLEVAACGVCGTDLHIYDDEFVTDPPVTLGHEISGTVVKVGTATDSTLVGARVVSEAFYSSCGRCIACRSARPNMCAEKRALGTFVDGGFAHYVTVPQRNLHRIPDWLDQRAAALSEPLACVCNCLLEPPAVTAGRSVLVVGPGPVGILAAQVARACGGEVTLLGTAADTDRLAVAAALGLRTTTTPPKSGGTRDNIGFDVVIECSGSQGGITTALEAVRKRGRYVQVGVVGSPVFVPFDNVFYKELVVSSGQGAPPAAWPSAMSLIAHRMVQLEPLVSEAAPLRDWERVFAAIRAARGVKYVLDPHLEG